MDKIKPLFTATATATGGRNGHTESSDGIVKADLSVPKQMGGPGKPGTATPEHLFAAGYAACFGGALDYIGKQHKKDASKARDRLRGHHRAARGRRLRARSQTACGGQEPAAGRAGEALAEEAHEKICPYSHATRGNVDVTFEIVGG